MFRSTPWGVAACAALLALPAVAGPPEDPALRKLIDESLAASPEVAAARAVVAAEDARVPQSSAPPDPTLSVGVQNDGFTHISIGTAETSFVSVALTQPLYWPGKSAAREQVATLEVRRARARLSRVELDVEVRARRALLELQLVRGQLALLAEQQALWVPAEAVARARYEAGQVPQSDLLRAQLERARLEQRAWTLRAQENARLIEIARLRGQPPADSPAPLLSAQPELEAPSDAAALEDAVARSPELLLARLSAEQAGARTELARKEQLPDMAVTAGVMVRGAIEPMWQVGFSVGLPAWSDRKQRLAVVESQQRAIADAQTAESVLRALRAATGARQELLRALVRTSARYRNGLLVLSEASARSALAQYEVGRLPFASVLEALSALLTDRAGQLEALAEQRRVAIAQRELLFEFAPGGLSLPAAAAIPGGGSRPFSAGAAAQSAAPAATPAPTGMAGM
jgi:outer membrane protein TolC